MLSSTCNIVITFFLLSLLNKGQSVLLVGPNGEHFLFNGIRKPVDLNKAQSLCEAAGGKLPGEMDGTQVVFSNHAIPDEKEIWLNFADPFKCFWIPRKGKCCGKYLIKKQDKPVVKYQRCEEPALVLCEITTSLEGFTKDVTNKINGLTEEFEKLSTSLTEITHDKLDPLETRINDMYKKFDEELQEVNEKDQENRVIMKEVQQQAADTVPQGIKEFKEWLEKIESSIGKPFEEVKKPLEENKKVLEDLKNQDFESYTKLKEQLQKMNTDFEKSIGEFDKTIEDSNNALNGLEQVLSDKSKAVQDELERQKKPVEEEELFKKILDQVVAQARMDESVTKSRDQTEEIVKKLEGEMQVVKDDITSAEDKEATFEEQKKEFTSKVGDQVTDLTTLLRGLKQDIKKERERRTKKTVAFSIKKRSVEETPEGKDSIQSLKEMADKLAEDRKKHQSEVSTFKVTFFPILGILFVIVIIQAVFLYRKRDSGIIFGRMIEDNDL